MADWVGWIIVLVGLNGQPSLPWTIYRIYPTEHACSDNLARFDSPKNGLLECSSIGRPS